MGKQCNEMASLKKAHFLSFVETCSKAIQENKKKKIEKYKNIVSDTIP